MKGLCQLIFSKDCTWHSLVSDLPSVPLKFLRAGIPAREFETIDSISVLSSNTSNKTARNLRTQSLVKTIS